MHMVYAMVFSLEINTSFKSEYRFDCQRSAMLKKMLTFFFKVINGL